MYTKLTLLHSAFTDLFRKEIFPYSSEYLQGYYHSPTIIYVGLFKMFSRWIWGIFNIQIQSDIGLFKMFSRWICYIFNIQIRSDRGHKLMLFIFQNKDKDLLGIYQYGCDPFCVSLLTDRHLKVCSIVLFTHKCLGETGSL